VLCSCNLWAGSLAASCFYLAVAATICIVRFVARAAEIRSKTLKAFSGSLATHARMLSAHSQLNPSTFPSVVVQVWAGGFFLLRNLHFYGAG
jgi:hypothetical protein